MGGDFDHCWTQTRESVLAMKELWPVRSYPKPAQKPHPPVLLGGGAKNVVRPPTVKTESEMAAGLTRIAEAVLR